MIRELLKKLTEPEPDVSEPDVSLAATVLMVEIMKADHDTDDAERDELLRAISLLTGKQGPDASALLQEAEDASADAPDLYHFTHVVHNTFSPEQKFTLLKALWRVAYADDELDKYEESTIRRIAELLYIPHSEFIRAKLEARDGQPG